LKYAESFEDIRVAISREKQLKRWSRKKKEALMNGEIEKLKAFSRCPLRQAQGDTERGGAQRVTLRQAQDDRVRSTGHPSTGSG